MKDHSNRKGGTPLPPNHYCVQMTYAPIPSLAQLQEKFDRVSDLFDGRGWELHASCVGLSESAGEKVFWVAAPPEEVLDNSEKIIVWADKLGYRPATHQEAIEFADAYPDLQHQFWIMALGSFVLDHANWSFARLSNSLGGHELNASWFAWGDDAGRFLFVRII